MTEDRMQFQCVNWFHNTYPDHRGMLFEINNKTDKGAYRKGLGLVRGASDLAYVSEDGIFVGAELKLNGTRHEVDHLSRQLSWGRKLTKRGGLYVFIFSIEQFEKFMKAIINGDCDIYDTAMETRRYVQSLIDSAKTKTVKIDYDG